MTTALITGASSGIGLELAKIHAAKGGNLVLVARSRSKYGYASMMKGKTVAIHGLKNKILANSVRFFPRAMVVKINRKIQDKAK